MPKKRPAESETPDVEPVEHHLRAWREFRQLSQEALGKMAGTTGSVVHLIETGQRKLSDKWMRRFAGPLGCQAGWLVDYDPNELDNDILEMWNSVPKEKRKQAREILETFRAKRA